MEKGYVLQCEVVAGQDLIACDDNGLSDPYVIVQVGPKKFKTKVIRETLNPVWAIGASKSEVFTFTNKQVGKSGEVVFRCFDWDRFDADDRMGQVTMTLKDLKDQKMHDNWYPLVPQKSGDKVKGKLHLRVQIKKASKKKVKHSLLWNAVKTTSLREVKEHAEKHSDWNETGDDDISLLHLALAPAQVNSDAEQILITLLTFVPASNINAQDANGNTPLHDFCRKYKSPSCKQAFDLFIQKGADVNLGNNDGETPLHHVVFNPSLKILLAELLISKGALINQKNNHGDSCVHYSMSSGRTDLIKLWVANEGNFDVVGSQGKTAIALAQTPSVESCVRDSLEVAKWLRSNGFEKYIGAFVEQEIYLFLLVDLDENAIGMIVADPEDRTKIIAKAKAKKDGKFMKREDTFRRKAQHLEKQNQNRQKEITLRNRLKNSVQSGVIKEDDDKLMSWEIDINDLDFSKKLGDGAAGEVYKGHWRSRAVAIKVLKATNDQAVVDEFCREFSIMVNVQSPYLVEFFGATLKEKLSMVMELCERGSLYKVLREPGDISWELGMSVLSDCANGMAVLHHHNPVIVHRDLKTLNVLVTKDWRCKVADFGLSRFHVDENAPTLHKCRGTYAYIAPEVFRSEGYLPPADIYSYSIMIWEIVARIMKGTYEKPFAEYTHLKMDVQVLVQAAKLGKRPTVKDNCPRLFGDLIVECWDPAREKRPTIDDVINRLAVIKKDFANNKETYNALLPPKQT
jgi:ankyrin repeat protein